ncbi:MAG: hypothetical protein WCT05_04790 [Lentisphaeria bacterium]
MSLSDIIQEKGALLAFLGKHPVLKFNFLVDFIDAYFHGLILVALNDVKTIPPERANYLEKVQLALNLNATDTSQKIQQFAKLDDKVCLDMLTEVIPTIAAHSEASKLFFMEAVTIIVQGKYNKKKAALICSQLANIFDINEKSRLFSSSMNLISQGISSSTLAPLANIYSWDILAYFFPEVIKKSEARNQDLLAKIKANDATCWKELIQKEYPDMRREEILILLLPYLKELFAQLKRIIKNDEGKCDHSRYFLDLNGYEEFERFKSTIDLLDLYWFKDQYFAMDPYGEMRSQISWTQVKEPKHVAKENYIELLKKWLDELEHRLA